MSQNWEGDWEARYRVAIGELEKETARALKAERELAQVVACHDDTHEKLERTLATLRGVEDSHRRAEAENDQFRARIAELEADREAELSARVRFVERADRAESELAQLRERVAEVLRIWDVKPHRVEDRPAFLAALEALRGE